MATRSEGKVDEMMEFCVNRVSDADICCRQGCICGVLGENGLHVLIGRCNSFPLTERRKAAKHPRELARVPPPIALFPLEIKMTTSATAAATQGNGATGLRDVSVESSLSLSSYPAAPQSIPTENLQADLGLVRARPRSPVAGL